ncbi:MAG: SOS response-associated peptidase [Pedobacter sp.]|nr:MAG: SOS response-associated peptidase [Pedobacter sp.]
MLMCYHVSQDSNAAALKAKYKAQYPLENQHHLFFHANGFAHPELALVCASHLNATNLNNAYSLPVHNDSSEMIINRFKWGLIPHWVKDWDTAKKLRIQTLNAVSETVFEKPSFRDSIMTRRCIIPVTGFFEWKHLEKHKQPFYIYPADEVIFNLAGIYSSWKNPSTLEVMNTFSILTKEASGLMADIHNSKFRQPVFIQNQHVASWLNPTLSKNGVLELFQDKVEIDAHPISNLISSKVEDSNIPDVTLPLNLL